MLRAAALAFAAAARGEGSVHRAAAVANMSGAPGRLGVVNGRATRPGEWDGVVMVFEGECGANPCSGTFIHPEVVMTAAHCCGGTKAICGGKTRPGTLLAYSVAHSRHFEGANDFCLLHLDRPVPGVPVYEVCSAVSTGDATIVGYGVSRSGTPPQEPDSGLGTQRDGLVRITRVDRYDLTVAGRTSGAYQNACDGDSGGPIFVPTARGVCVAGSCSRGPRYCPPYSEGIYTSAAEHNNARTLASATSGWGAAVTPGQCPVAQCCYSMTCGAQPTREPIRLVVGGSLAGNSPVLDYYRGFPPNGVKYITAAGTNPTSDGTSIGNFFRNAGIEAEWIPVHSTNCAERTRDPQYIQMVEEADAIYMSGGQSGRLQSCLFGDYQQSGRDGGVATPFLDALRAKAIVGGSSAGAMNQPLSEILITGHSAESYAAVRAGAVFRRDGGNVLLTSDELVDVHFSERGRQGRLVVMAMETQQRWAYGVDENTAYVWRPSGEYEVVGAAGVVVYEGTTGTAQSQRALMHFLTSGDRIDPATGRITYNPDKTPCASRRAPRRSNSIFSGVNYRTISIETAKGPAGTTRETFHGSPAVQVTFISTANTTAACGPSGESFTHLTVEQFQSSQDPAFVNSEKPELPLDHIWEIDS